MLVGVFVCLTTQNWVHVLFMCENPPEVQNHTHLYSSQIFILKEPGPIISDFSQTFRDFGRKLLFFSLPPGEFYGWKMYRLDDINENVTSYGNHN